VLNSNSCVLLAALLLAAFYSTGCANHASSPVLPDVGPVSGVRNTIGQNAKGLLEVFSATESNNDGGILYRPYTAYTIHDTNGRKVRSIMNRVGLTDSTPMKVTMPVGRYFVHAQSMRFGVVTVPVIISADRLTQVYLDGANWPNEQGLPDAELVRLPDGQVVGRRATPLPPAD
jgi:hypothetical protein